jgi:hypothetical protein
MRITEAMNVYNPALFNIKSKGYVLSIVLDEKNEEIVFWVAEKDSVKLSGFNPLSLLGLIQVAESYSEQWRNISDSDIYSELLEKSGHSTDETE